MQARVEELSVARDALEQRAQELQREVQALTEAVAAGPAPLSDRFLDDLNATLRVAYAEAERTRRGEQTRAEAECAGTRAAVAARLAELDEESRRAEADARDTARQLLADAARAAERIRTDASEAAAGLALNASTLVESSRVQASQRTGEYIAELEAGQRTAEQALEAAQQEASGRLAAAEQDFSAAGEQAASTAAAADQEAARILESARRAAAEIQAESDRVVTGLRQAAARIAAVLESNLSSATRFADGLHLTVEDPADQPIHTPTDADCDPDADGRSGLLAEVVSLLPRRRAR